ncbi:MAG: rhodanese-like domain-containing protein [Candidatus Kariarchaeaceae archaeon]|jgi:rhodanese-related sulfurtransferase
METISREEVKEKLDRGDDIKLVMVLGLWHFHAKRIPGSIHIGNPNEIEDLLNKEDEIVVYCSNEDCVASQVAYQTLKQKGYENVKRYSGGIHDWEEAGLPLEGEMVS